MKTEEITLGGDLTVVQELLCRAMDAIHKVCRENGITYYLIGGSALGAVRHRGFIPWDVDIDIAMHRPQYEAFAQIAPRCLPEGYSYHDHRNTRNYFRPHATVTIDQVKAVLDDGYYREKKEENLFIDIFPLDHAPDQLFLRERQAAEIRKLIKLHSRKECILYQRNSLAEIAAKRLIQAALLPYPLKRLEAKRDQVLTRYDGQETRCWCSMLSRYPYTKQCMPKAIYGRPVEMEFCGRKYCLPQQTGEYLERIFGETYMELPPPEQRMRPDDQIKKIIVYGSSAGGLR